MLCCVVLCCVVLCCVVLCCVVLCCVVGEACLWAPHLRRLLDGVVLCWLLERRVCGLHTCVDFSMGRDSNQSMGDWAESNGANLSASDAHKEILDRCRMVGTFLFLRRGSGRCRQMK